MMYFNGYYSVSKEGHNRYYGVISGETPEEAFELLYNECLEILKTPNRIVECYVDHTGEVTQTSKGHKFRTIYGFSDIRDTFKRGWGYCAARYVHLERPKL